MSGQVGRIVLIVAEIPATEGLKMATNFDNVTTAELIADIKQLLAERREQFERDYLEAVVA